ncbi:MAG TPA: MATE family efflux transporter [Caulobacteraceae bacterium]
MRSEARDLPESLIVVTEIVQKSPLAPVFADRTWLRAWTDEARALAVLAGPLVVTQLAQMAVMTTDIVLLGRFSRQALAAAAIGNTVYFFAWIVGGGPAFAVAPIIAQSLGLAPNDRAAVRRATRMGLWSVLIVCAPMLVLLWNTRAILLALGQDPVLAEGAGVFVRAVELGLPFTLGFRALGSFATAVGKPHAQMWVMAGMIGFNALAGYSLIFGHFGFPRLGILGSGLATASSSVVAFAAMTAMVRLDRSLAAYRVFRRLWRPAFAHLREVFRLGLPMAMTMMFEAMLFNVMTLVMGSFGVVPLAAHQIALNVASVTFMVPLGLGMASTVRVGLAIGAGDQDGARRAGLTAMLIGVAFISLCGLAMVLAGGPIASLYVGGRAMADLQVIAMAAVFLKVAAAFQVFDALQVVAAQALRGLKDARVPMFIAGGAYWLVGAPVCLILALAWKMQGLGIWIGFAVGLGAAAAALAARFLVQTRPA